MGKHEVACSFFEGVNSGNPECPACFSVGARVYVSLQTPVGFWMWCV